MGKYLRKVKDFLKRYVFKNKIISIVVSVAIIGIVLFIIINRTNVDSIKRVKRVLSNKYYKVECMSDACDYIIAYKGNKLGKNNILIYNAYGKKIASYKDSFNSNDKTIKNIYSVTTKYIIFKEENITSGNVEGYILATNKAKTKYISDNVLSSLNDYLVSEKLDETYNILDNNGKKLYTNVSKIKSRADGKYFSAIIKNEDVILNEKGEPILNGYSIAKQVKNEDDKTIYFVLQDSDKNAYYYYNLNNNKIIGTSFNGYIEGSKPGELVITKKENNESVKYILKQNGDTEKLSAVSLDTLKNIDSSKYEVENESYILSSQAAVLVRNISDNSFGTYNLKTKKYTKLFTFKGEEKQIKASKLLSNEKELYLQISCSNEYCEKNKLVVYDMVNDKKLYEITNKDFEIQYFTNYNEYNVIKYSSNSSDDYKNKYAVYDKNNKEIFKSDNQIVIVDRKLVFGKEPSSYSLILFNSKNKKALNSSDTLANKVTLGKTYFYKFSDTEKTYLYNANGEKLKIINNANTSFIYSTETMIYLEKNKVYIINPTDNRTSTYKLRDNEMINAYDGESIPPYRNTLFINNTVDNNIKVVNVNGRTIKNIKNSIIESVDYNKKSKNVIIVTKQVKNNNNYYGLYIGK